MKNPAILRLISLALAFGPVLGSVAGVAEQVGSLARSHTIYVAAFSGSHDAARLRASFIKRIEGGRFQIVSSPQQADAVIQGSAQIWLRGYIAINPRTPSTDRQPVFGGYLSITVTDAKGEPLWSWLVTPSRNRWTTIVDDLSGQAARKFVDAAQQAYASFNAPPSSGPLAAVSLSGSGATFPAPLYQKWFQDFEQLHPGVHIRYSPVGSQRGAEMLTTGSADFAGSDVAPDFILGTASHLRAVISVVGGVVPIYNLQGVTTELHFTPDALAGIYLGKIRRWNDPEIRNSNKGVALPDAEIVVIHRSDGSGTTWVWSDFLSRASPQWLSTVGRGTTLHWPVGTGAERNDGVAQAVHGTPNSIGYVELTYAIQNQLNFGSVRNRSGVFVRADLDSVAAAAKGPAASSDLASSLVDSASKDAYPIASFTWLIMSDQLADSPKQRVLSELFRWVLTTGQRECSALGYAPLPRRIAEKELREIDSGSSLPR